MLCEETTYLLQKLSLDSQPKAADATEPARTKKVEMKQNIVDFHLVDFHLNLMDETEPRGMSVILIPPFVCAVQFSRVLQLASH